MIRIGIIGAGGIAQAHVQSLLRLSNVRVVAVADTNQEKAQTTAARCGAQAMTDYREVFGLVDAVYICTPPTLHREQAIAAAEAGKSVFCEKPLATTQEDGEAIVRSVQEHGVKMMVGFNHRFRPPFQRMRETCASGALGRVLSFWTTRMSPDTPTGNNWRVTPGLLCGITIESASHDIDLLQWICGGIATVRGMVINSLVSLEGYDDNMSAIMTLRGGGVANFHISWSSHVSFNTRGVVGTKGTVCVEGPGMWNLSAVRPRMAGSEREGVVAIPADEAGDMGYLAEDRHFVECLERGKAFSVTEQDGLAALRVSLAILRSSREDRVVKIDAGAS